jgi:CMP-N,N'-diacetyllegionaminic acid synthase
VTTTSCPVLAIIPARGGSKGVPGKNVRPLAGRTLLDYAAEAARQSAVVDRAVLTTDSEEVAAAGRAAGLHVLPLRPAWLASDHTPMLPVVWHAIEQVMGEGFVPELVVLLQPTSPLRRPEHVRDAVRLLRDSGADSVVTVVEVPRHLSPDYVMRIDQGVLRPFLSEGARVTRRQDTRPAFSRDGTVYAFRRDTIERHGTIYGEDCRPLVIAGDESLSIDTPRDWAEAERALQARGSR